MMQLSFPLKKKKSTPRRLFQLTKCPLSKRKQQANFIFIHSGLTSILRLDGNDPLPLRTKALGGPGLDFELVGDILDQVWDGQTRLRTIAMHLEGPHIS